MIDERTIEQSRAYCRGEPFQYYQQYEDKAFSLLRRVPAVGDEANPYFISYARVWSRPLERPAIALQDVHGRYWLMENWTGYEEFRIWDSEMPRFIPSDYGITPEHGLNSIEFNYFGKMLTLIANRFGLIMENVLLPTSAYFDRLMDQGGYALARAYMVYGFDMAHGAGAWSRMLEEINRVHGLQIKGSDRLMIETLSEHVGTVESWANGRTELKTWTPARDLYENYIDQHPHITIQKWGAIMKRIGYESKIVRANGAVRVCYRATR